MPATNPEYHVPDESIESLPERLDEFLEPYYPHFGRIETHGHAHMYVEGRLQRLDRRTLEPIATEHGVHRRALQLFVGAARWQDDPIVDQMTEQVAEEIGTPDGVLILDGSGFQKWGTACRHYIEQSIETAKGDAGLAEYEVRSWVGWQHHMTLSLLAMLFLVRERVRLKKTHRR